MSVDLMSQSWPCPVWSVPMEAPHLWGAAVIVTKTCTLEERSRPVNAILKRCGEGWINRAGLVNPGLAKVKRELKDFPVNLDQVVVSVASTSIEMSAWGKIGESLAGMSIRGVEIDFSCPTMSREDPGRPEDIGRAIQLVQEWSGLPVGVKFSPMVKLNHVRVALQGEPAWLTLCNALKVDRGGLSGAPIRSLSLDLIHRVRDQEWGQDVPICGVGGIYTPSHAEQYVRAGANMVGLGSVRLDHFTPTMVVSTRDED